MPLEAHEGPGLLLHLPIEFVRGLKDLAGPYAGLHSLFCELDKWVHYFSL